MTKPKGKKFRAQYTDPITKQRRSISAGSEAELQARLQRISEIRRDLRYGLDPQVARRAMRPVAGRVLTVDEAFDRYARAMNPKSGRKARDTWRRDIEPHLGGARAWELDPDRMAQWVATLATTGGRTGRGRAPNTIWLAWDYLAAAFARLVPRELPALPWGSWKPNLPRGKDARQTRRECVQTLEQLEALVCAAHRKDCADWARGHYAARTATLVTLLLTGIRQAEAAGLAWDTVQLDVGVPMLHVWAQAPRNWPQDWPGRDRPPALPKSKRRRSQRLHPSVVLVLREQREQLRGRGWYRADGPVFPRHADGGWRTSGQVMDPAAMRRLAAEAGLPNPHLWVTHSTRHSFATLEAIGSKNLRATQSRTGHSSLDQVEGYFQLAGGALPESPIPELAPEVLRRALDAASTAPALPPKPQPKPRPADSSPEAADMMELAREWVRTPPAARKAPNGRQLARPPQVTEHVRAVRARAYKRAQRAGLAEAAAQRKGRQARAAALGGWGRCLRLAERELAENN